VADIKPEGFDYRVPVPEVVVQVINETAHELGGRGNGGKLPDGWGFALLVFTYGGGTMTYISSAQRADMILAMQEFLRKQANA
jgi:hypothetical protein